MRKLCRTARPASGCTTHNKPRLDRRALRTVLRVVDTCCWRWRQQTADALTLTIRVTQHGAQSQSVRSPSPIRLTWCVIGIAMMAGLHRALRRETRLALRSCRRVASSLSLLVEARITSTSARALCVIPSSCGLQVYSAQRAPYMACIWAGCDILDWVHWQQCDLGTSSCFCALSGLNRWLSLGWLHTKSCLVFRF